MNKLCTRYKKEETEMRVHYCNALITEAERNPNILSIDIDTSTSMGTKAFHETLGDRGINCGIMEAHAVGMAAGLSATGYIPFLHTFATFASRRAYDQVFLSCAYQNLNVKIIGGDAGVTATSNGGTHMPFEDMGIMRNIPGMTILEPADSAMIPEAVRHMANTYGNFYMRYGRRNMMRVYGNEEKFEIGRANILKNGKDVAIIACGVMVYESLMAAKELALEGIDALVMDMHTIKPIDSEAVKEVAKYCGAIVTAENHNIINGLGSAVCEVICENVPIPLERVGVKDVFGEVGTQDYLMKKFGLTAAEIYKKVKKAIKRRRTG